jgi:phosphotriesterase-related protein
MKVATVLGDIDVQDLGRTLIHEHLFIAFPGAEFDPLARFDRAVFVDQAVNRLKELRSFGVRTFVDPCPMELGRDPLLMAEVSEKAEMNIICTTGFYMESMGIPQYWRNKSAEEIADVYVTELTRGIGKTGVRPAAIKCATSPVASKLEETVLRAATMAHRATGAPIITHTTNGVGGPEQQKLFAAGGVPAHRCLIGHCCDNADPAYHRRVVDGGSYIGFDRIGYEDIQPSAVMADNLVRLISDGFAEQVLISQDRYCGMLGRSLRRNPTDDPDELERMKAAGEWPPSHAYLFRTFLPLLRQRGIDEAQFNRLLDDNPIRFFAGTELPLRRQTPHASLTV